MACDCCACDDCCGHDECPDLYMTLGCDECAGPQPGAGPPTLSGTVVPMGDGGGLTDHCPCEQYQTSLPVAPAGPTCVFCTVRLDLKCGKQGTGQNQRNTVRVYSDGGGLCQSNGGQFEFIEGCGEVGCYVVNSCNPVDVDVFCQGGTHKIHE